MLDTEQVTYRIEPSAHEFLNELYTEAGITRGLMFRILLAMVKLVISQGYEDGKIPQGTQIPAIEAYAVLTAYNLGLLSDAELERIVVLADAMGGERTDLRLRGLQTLINERMTGVRSAWQSARDRREQERRRNPLAMDAADRAALDMLRADAVATQN